MNKIEILTFTIIIFIVIVLPGSANNDIPITYKTYVDNEYGFYKVRDITTNKPAPFIGRKLTINVGDTVLWESDIASDKALTLVSEQNLWNNAYVRGDHKFEYMFIIPGTYNIHVKEYPQLRQEIIVESSATPTINPTISMTPAPTVTQEVTQSSPKIVETTITPKPTIAPKSSVLVINFPINTINTITFRFIVMSIVAAILSVSLFYMIRRK